MRYIDFHSHITPAIDDGAQSTEESLHMLRIAKESGAEAVVLTPHYYSDVPITEFIAGRDRRIKKLKRAINESCEEYPLLLAGTEVYLAAGLSENEDLNKLCIEGTNLLLLEMPYTNWNKWHMQEVYNIVARQNVTPVMAHIERYFTKPKDLHMINPLISVGAKFQVNAKSFLSFSGKRVIKALAHNNLICAIGSDCHDLVERSPDISRAMRALQKRLGNSFMDAVFENSRTLLKL